MGKQKRVLLLIVSILMIVTAPVFLIFSMSTIYHYDIAAPYPYSDLGGLISAGLYFLMFILGILGIVFHRKNSTKICRIGGWVLLAAGIVNAFLLAGNFFIEIPLFLFLVLYLTGAKKRTA